MICQSGRLARTAFASVPWGRACRIKRGFVLIFGMIRSAGKNQLLIKAVRPYLLSLLGNDIDVIFWILIVLDVFAGTAKLEDESQKLINAERAIVKRFTFKPA
jgi:hypothetical protein